MRMRTVPNISSMVRKIEDFLTNDFISAVTGGVTCSIPKRKLLALLASKDRRPWNPSIQLNFIFGI